MGKIKQFIESEQGKDLLIVLIVIFVGLGSFELGRLSKSSGSSGIQIENLGTGPTALGGQKGSVINAVEYAPTFEQATNNPGKNYFASSRGTKYYTAGCSAGKTIKQENRVYFDTSGEAEDAGYTLSTSCN